MRLRMFPALGCGLVLTFGLAAPLGAAPPQLVITDMDSAQVYLGQRWG